MNNPTPSAPSPSGSPPTPPGGSAGAPPALHVPTFTDPEPSFSMMALVLGLLLPGAGHAYLGEARRARLIATGVLGMFFGGMLIGGIDVVDKREDFPWFLGQALVGPIAFGVDYYHQNHIKVLDRSNGQRRSAHPYEIRNPSNGEPVQVRDPETNTPMDFLDPRTKNVRTSIASDRPPNTKSLGRVNEIGTLFATLAGMLNLICVIDAATRGPGVRRRETGRAGA